MNGQKVERCPGPEDLPLEHQDEPIDCLAIPKRWKPPPSPIFLRAVAWVVLVVTFIGAQILLRINGQEPDAAFFETCLILAGEIVVLWFVFAIRWAWLERQFAPTQHHYRHMLIGGFLALIALFVILLLVMGRSSRDSKNNPKR